MPLFETLVSTFPDLDDTSSKWYGQGAFVVGSGELAIAARTLEGAPVFSFARSRGGYTLIGSSLTLEVTAVPGPVGSGAFAQVWVMDPTPDITVARLGFEYVAEANRLDFLGQAGDDYAPIGTTASITFDAVAHRWLRLRHTGTIIVWETSPTGAAGSWTVQRTLSSDIPAWTAKGTLLASIEAYRTTGDEDRFRVDNINAGPGAAPPPDEVVESPVTEDAWVAAIESSDQRPIYRLRADWNRTGHFDHPLSDLTPLVEQVSVSRSLGGGDPAIDLVEGYSSASLRATLLGQWPDSAEGSDNAPAVVRRTNLAPNPSIETGTAGYSSVTSGTLTTTGVSTAQSVQPPFGAAYIYYRSADNGTSGTAFIRCPLVPVNPGHKYTFSAYRQVVGTLASTYVGVDWMDANGNQIGVASGPAITGLGWVRGAVFATAPAGAAHARQFLVSGTTNYANYARWDGILAETGSILRPYFDGDSPECSWTGTPHASSSLLVSTPRRGVDDDYSAVEVFAPYRTDSPFYGWDLIGTPVQLDTGFVTADGERLERRFTGTVRRISPRSGGRSVTFEALDPAHRLRRPITIPAVAAYESFMRRYGPEVYRARINSQWLVDRILREHGICASPPARADAVLSVTAHGSFIPEIGWGGAPEEFWSTYRGPMWTNTDHPYGMLRPIAMGIGRWWLTTPLTAMPGTGFGMSMLQRLPGPVSTRQTYLTFDISVDKSWGIIFGFDTDGRPYVGIDGPAANDLQVSKPLGWTPGAANRFTFLGVHVSFGATTMTTRWRIDGQNYTNTVTIAARAAGVWKPDVVANYRWQYPFTNFQMWLSPTAPPTGTPWTGEVWTSQADIDPGANEWTGIPDILGEDARELLKQICAAEGSRFEFDETGRAKFITRVGDQLRGSAPTSVETITADRNLTDLVSTVDEASVRNIITVKTAKLLLGDWEDYFKAETVDQFLCGTGTTYWDIELPSAAYEVPPPLSTFGSANNPGSWTAYGGDGFIYYGSNEAWSNSAKQDNVKQYIRVMVNNADQPTAYVGAGVQIRVERLSPWKMRIIVNNQMPHRIRFATMDTVNNGVVTAGQPALIIPARMVKAAPEQLETLTDQASVDTYGPSTYAIGGAQRWAQDPDMLRELGLQTLPRTRQALPKLDAVNVTHDPRRKLAQQHELADPDGLGSTTANLLAITQTFSRSGAVDSITSRPTAAPGQA